MQTYGVDEVMIGRNCLTYQWIQFFFNEIMRVNVARAFPVLDIIFIFFNLSKKMKKIKTERNQPMISSQKKIDHSFCIWLND